MGYAPALRWMIASGSALVTFAITWAVGQRLFGLDAQSAIGVATVAAGAVSTPLLWWAGREHPKRVAASPSGHDTGTTATTSESIPQAVLAHPAGAAAA